MASASKRKRRKQERAGKRAETAKAGNADEAPQREAWRKSWVRDYFESIIIAVVLALFIRTFVVQTFKIPSGSMKQTLLVGDHILVNKFAFAPASGWLRKIMPYTDIERGDIVVFKWPKEPRKDYIKRVIGLPGDVVELCQGHLYLNGVLEEEPFINVRLGPVPAGGEAPLADGPVVSRCPQGHARGRDRLWFYGPRKVPEGHLLVMGDNRLNSSDSRDWGFVPREYVKGRALLIYWSFEAEDEQRAATGKTSARDLLFVALHFFDRTRWGRTFMLVR